MLEKSQGADRALLYSDFGFLGVNRKKARRKEDRGEEKEATSRGKEESERERDISMERSDEERRRKVEPY